MKRKKMNRSIIVILSVLLSLCSINIYAKHNKNQLDVETFDYKCHVEILGGGDTIHFVNSQSKNLSVVAQSIKGQKIHKPFSKNVSSIYNVVECTSLYGNFKNNVSKLVDSKTVR